MYKATQQDPDFEGGKKYIVFEISLFIHLRCKLTTAGLRKPMHPDESPLQVSTVFSQLPSQLL